MKTFTTNETFHVPAGVTSIFVQAWGGGGSGAGASGSPLLLGRGAAGGGGGAYASAPILVTPGTNLNIVVAGQTSATTANGTAGGNSTITGFETSILAAGGSGGAANNAGGTPLGGIGGTVAASAGTVKFAGGNGGNGNSWNLLGLLLSSGAGGAGAGSGGLGGTAVSGLLLSNAPGNAGSPPGGAGSGAINSALGASQIGGAGAAGRVIISYSCANFSLTGTSATSICASAGTTSSVTITGSPASLPVGNYVVTYDRSSPGATGLTANLTVSTAGTGTFIATGLSTVGSSTITITKLTSESCSSNITSNNTAVVTISAATVAGTVSGGTTICSGATSGVLTLSGHSGSIVKWQSSVSPFTTWTDIANTTVTYTSGILTETTQFRAVVQNGVFCAALNSTATEVTVIPRPTITISSDANPISCSNDDERFPSFTYSATTGSPVTYSITWNQSPPNSFVAVTDKSLSPESIQISVPANTGEGTYTGTVTVKDANGCVSLGATFNVNVIDPPSITTTGILDEINTSTSSQNALLSYTASVNNPVRYSVIWDSDAIEDQSETLFNFSSSGGVINTIVIPANTPAGTYTGKLIIGDSSVFCSSVQSISITINALPTIELAAAATTVCSSSTIQTTDLSYGSLTGSPTTYSIVWDVSPANSFATVIDGAIPASPFTIVIPAGTVAGTYTGTLTVKNANGAVSTPGSIFTVTVNPSPTITLTQTEFNACSYNSFSQPIELAYSNTTGSPLTYSIVWDASSPNNSFANVTNESLPDSPIEIEIPEGTIAGTYTGILTVKNAAGCVSSNSSFDIHIQESPTITSTGQIDSVNQSTSAQNASLTYSGVTGDPTSYSLYWGLEALGASFENQEDVPFTFVSSGGVINNIEIPANVAPGSYTGTMYIINGTCFGVLPVTITVNALPTIELASSAADICPDVHFFVNSTTLNYSATTGNPVTYSIVWNASPANNLSQITDAQLPDSPITIIVPVSTNANTYTGTLTVKDASGNTSLGSVFTLKVNQLVNISAPGFVVSIDPVNTSSSPQTTTLTYDSTTGSPTSYSVDWNDQANLRSLADQPITSFAFAPNGGILNNIEISADVLPGTYQGRLKIYGEICETSIPVSIEITEPAPTIQTAPSANLVCSNINAQTTKLAVGAITGSPTTYSIVWNTSPANNFVDVTDATLVYNSPFIIDVPAGTAVATYTGTLTVKNANGVESSGNSFTVTVNQGPTITTTGIINSVCSSNNPQGALLQYTTSSGSPSSYSIDWDVAANDALLEDKPTTSFTFSTSTTFILIDIAPNVLPGTYSGTLVINNAVCSQSYPISITITTGLVGGTVTGGTTITSGSTSGLLTLSGNTGGVTKWQSSVSPFTTWSDIANKNKTYTSGPLTETTQFRAVVQGGTCFIVNSESTTVTVLSSFGKSISEIASAGTDLESAEKATTVTAFNQVINVETTNQTINQVFVFDVAGNLLYRKDGVSDSKLIINSLRSSNQVLVVKVVLNDNRIATKKVIY
ncbi:hypothetical protein ASF10_20520 [Flavobacterium sp. Leaf82]|uniref:T9SS sorting signal type C domain-containing protein n=1 Tax=Flavobacterium sp. Leaf82 TaxID=1736238 RepID=UPI0006F693DA|nr:T9SS sorting signal type C domain-containing protein [Flavobacterium sp. Leaf82]KQO32840.1 hypothetical protein ASF10_20520 [Flavobacterium sp. Leaf82]